MYSENLLRTYSGFRNFLLIQSSDLTSPWLRTQNVLRKLQDLLITYSLQEDWQAFTITENYVCICIHMQTRFVMLINEQGQKESLKMLNWDAFSSSKKWHLFASTAQSMRDRMMVFILRDLNKLWGILEQHSSREMSKANHGVDNNLSSQFPWDKCKHLVVLDGS